MDTPGIAFSNLITKSLSLCLSIFRILSRRELSTFTLRLHQQSAERKRNDIGSSKYHSPHVTSNHDDEMGKHIEGNRTTALMKDALGGVW